MASTCNIFFFFSKFYFTGLSDHNNYLGTGGDRAERIGGKNT